MKVEVADIFYETDNPLDMQKKPFGFKCKQSDQSFSVQSVNFKTYVINLIQIVLNGILEILRHIVRFCGFTGLVICVLGFIAYFLARLIDTLFPSSPFHPFGLSAIIILFLTFTILIIIFKHTSTEEYDPVTLYRESFTINKDGKCTYTNNSKKIDIKPNTVAIYDSSFHKKYYLKIVQQDKGTIKVLSKDKTSAQYFAFLINYHAQSMKHDSILKSDGEEK